MNKPELKQFIIDNTSNAASRDAALYYFLSDLNITHSAEKAGVTRQAAQKTIRRLNKILKQNGHVFIRAILPVDKADQIINYIEESNGRIEK